MKIKYKRDDDNGNEFEGKINVIFIKYDNFVPYKNIKIFTFYFEVLSCYFQKSLFD